MIAESGVLGFREMQALTLFFLMNASCFFGALHALIYFSLGSSTMRCTSRGMLVLMDLTNAASTVVGGTNLPSMMSTWIKSEQPSTCLISLFICLKSAERMDGAILILGIR